MLLKRDSIIGLLVNHNTPKCVRQSAARCTWLTYSRGASKHLTCCFCLPMSERLIFDASDKAA
jgi:hypothetical protein